MERQKNSSNLKVGDKVKVLEITQYGQRMIDATIHRVVDDKGVEVMLGKYPFPVSRWSCNIFK